MSEPIPLLIVGAGPFGLAMSACARHRGIEHTVVGRPMEFWKSAMPEGMFLRSGCDWHYDPLNEHTIERYLGTKNRGSADVEPLPLDLYLGYSKWFQQQKGIEIVPALVQSLNRIGGAAPVFVAVLHDGGTLTARNVVLALGFQYFTNVPDPYPALFPPRRFCHTGDCVEFSRFEGKRILIIGGRQSAFEWAALIRERGAKTVHVCYRHATPSFEPSDWSWVSPLVDAMTGSPGWYRRLTATEKEAVNRRLWTEGRLKLEPWLAARINRNGIELLPLSHVTMCRDLPCGALEVTLNSGRALEVDHIVLGTGYKVDVRRIPLLAAGNILPQLETGNGFPALDEHLQSNIPGLFFTSMCATQDFGPFFAFTVSVRTSAILIAEDLIK